MLAIRGLRLFHRFGRGEHAAVHKLSDETPETIEKLVFESHLPLTLERWCSPFLHFERRCEPWDHFPQKAGTLYCEMREKSNFLSCGLCRGRRTEMAVSPHQDCQACTTRSNDEVNLVLLRTENSCTDMQKYRRECLGLGLCKEDDGFHKLAKVQTQRC